MLPIYDVLIGEMNTISLVEHPATEENFLCFSEKKELKLSFDEEKHIVFGPALVANKPIYRRDNAGREYYVVFTEQSIERLYMDFMKNSKFFNLEHSDKIANCYLIESFIKRVGLNPVGFEEVSDGSWFISLKVEDDALWEQIKQGKFNGFSIESTVEVVDEVDNLIDELL